jgi:hypothetical protein
MLLNENYRQSHLFARSGTFARMRSEILGTAKVLYSERAGR